MRGRLLGAVGGLLLPSGAAAQQVTNLDTMVAYATLTEALGAASAGDTLQVDGDVADTVTVDRDISVVGLPGAILRSSAGAILTLEAGVELTLEGVDLIATGATRAITAEAGGNTVVVRDALIDRGQGVSGDGAAVRFIDPLSATFERVTFLGTAGQVHSGRGGAIFATTTSAGSLILTDVVFDRTEATGSGGALYSGALATTCLRCVFDHTSGGFGGAIHATGALTVEQSLFCASDGSLGGAIFASGETEIRSTVFAENTASSNGGALYANDGDWTVSNNHFLGNGGTDVVYGLATSAALTNNLFHGNLSEAVDLRFIGSSSTSYNWFHGNPVDSAGPLSPTDVVGAGDPALVLWTRDGNCANDVLWPTPITSPLLDAGDPALVDPDGSRSDIGAYGGLYADPALHADQDLDGLPFLHDCDDADGANFPGNDERCDAQDNDCDLAIDEDPIDIDEFFLDCDGDGQGVAGTGVVQCFPPAPTLCGGGWASSNDLGPLASADCDDDDPTTYTGAYEYCDVVDHDCDGDASEGAVDATTYYEDLDNDGYGTTAFEICADAPPPQSALVGGDCQDQDATVYPGAEDPCGDAVDQDCDGNDGDYTEVESWFPDLDGDGYGDAEAEAVLDCRPGAGAGMVRDASDCDDGAAAVHPGAVEACNGRDDDCDGRSDNVGGSQTWYLDADGDGFGDPETATDGPCAPGADWVGTSGDCDDEDPARAADCDVGEILTDPGDTDKGGTCGCATPPGPGAGAWLAALAAGLGARRTGRRSGPT